MEPTTPRRQGTSAQSPRGIYDFPISPQSPGEGMVLSPPIKTTPMKTIPRSLWIAQENYIDLVPNCTQYSPTSNHPGHGFGDCNIECNRNSSSRDSSNSINGNKNLENKIELSPSLNQGDNVLVRCNKSKWLPGQVKRISNSSIKVWIGVAETLVDVPVELFPTHLARVECATMCSSPGECYTTRLYHTQQQIKTQVQCVRPAHLSHRHLFQVISPNNSIATSAQQMCQVQCPSPTSTNPRTKCETNPLFKPMKAPNPLNFLEHIACLEKNGIIPPKSSTLQQLGICSEQLNSREDSNPQEALFDGHKGFTNLQAQYNWRLHMYQRNQQGNRPSYPRPSTLPMLNVNLNNEGTPSSNSPFLLGKNCNNHHHIKTSPHGSPQQLYNINQEPPIHAFYEDSHESTLYKPHYEQFVAPQMVTKSTMTNFGDTKSPKRPPTPPPQLLTKGMMDLRDNKSSKRSLVPSHIKGKEICEDQECPSWAKGTDFHQILVSNQGMSLEESVSLDCFKPPNFPGLVAPRSPGARPSQNATSSTTPMWVTVIDNGQNTRKL
jgi:hypothetical protein